MKYAAYFLTFFCICFFSNAQTLKFQGSTNEETKILDSIFYSKTHSSIASIDKEVQLVIENLSKIGYLGCKKISLQKANDSLFAYKLLLGNKTKYVFLTIAALSEFKEIFRVNTQKNTVLLPYLEIENYLNESLYQLEKNGYAFSKLSLKNLVQKKDTLYADLAVDTHKIRKINEIVIKRERPESPIFYPKGYLVQIKKKYRNSIYNKETIARIHKDFENLSFASPIKYPEILFTKDTTKVYVYLKKRSSNSFDGFIGFANNESNKIAFNGYLDLKLANLLLAGEQFALYWKNDGQGQRIFKTSIDIPYLFNSPIGIKAQIDFFKQDSLFQNTKTNLDLGYLLNYKTRLYIGIQSTTSASIQNTVDKSIRDFKNTFLTANTEYTNADLENELLDKKTILGLGLGIGKRSPTTKTGADSANKQFYIHLKGQKVLRLNEKNFLNGRLETYFLNSGAYAANELFRFGGINSVRGFAENSLQASFATTLATEYRYLINPALFVHTILDYGIFTDPLVINTDTKTSTISGVGVGFATLLKSGVFKLLVANGNKKNQSFNFSNTILNISYTVKF